MYASMDNKVSMNSAFFLEGVGGMVLVHTDGTEL